MKVLGLKGKLSRADQLPTLFCFAQFSQPYFSAKLHSPSKAHECWTTAREWKCEACWAEELIEFADGSFGRALNLEAQTVGAVRFASSFGEQTCTEGSLVRTTSQVANILVGDSYRGRIVNALGAPVDGLGQIDRGRAGIIGDRQTGKTTVAVDAILNQTDVVCVYVAVGQKTSTIAEMISSLSQTKDMSCVVVVLSGADEASTLQIAPLVLLFLDQKADLGQMQANQHERVAANDAGRLNGDRSLRLAEAAEVDKVPEYGILGCDSTWRKKAMQSLTWRDVADKLRFSSVQPYSAAITFGLVTDSGDQTFSRDLPS